MFLLLLNGLLKHFNQVNITTNYCVGLANAPCLLNFQEALNVFIFVYYLIHEVPLENGGRLGALARPTQ